MSVFLSVFISTVSVWARPAPVFIPDMEDIQQKLPPGLAMRLPTEIPLSEPSDIAVSMAQEQPLFRKAGGAEGEKSLSMKGGL